MGFEKEWGSTATTNVYGDWKNQPRRTNPGDESKTNTLPRVVTSNLQLI